MYMVHLKTETTDIRVLPRNLRQRLSSSSPPPLAKTPVLRLCFS